MALSTTLSSSSASSPANSPWRYNVFLSFRGEDTRHTFTAHLYRALTQKGISTYLDEDELRRGDEISPALLQAIEASRISIIVLSKNYASSTWCLDELLKILDQCKKSKQQRVVLPVFYHVDPSDVRHQRESYGEALTKYAEKLNVDMKLQLWKEALREVANLSGYHLMRNGNESKFIEEIVQDISRMANDHLYLEVAKHPVGLKPYLEMINPCLSVGTDDIRMIGIFGVGGIGKTTLAKAIYNAIAFQFEASYFLVIVGDTSNQADHLVRLQETLLFQILGDCKSLKVDNIDKGITMIKQRLHSKRVLLILDGVVHLTQLETLAGAHDWFGEGSRIIITTRDKHLLTTHGVDSTYKMMRMNQNDAIQLFCWHAFKRDEPDDGYGELVEQIVNYAGRLPLALKVLGSDLCGRSESEWVSAIEEYKKIPHKDIQKILQTSYDRLSENEKNVFLDIACFFNGQVWPHDAIFIQMLDSFGFQPNFSIPKLREKCLISSGMLGMHDLLRDMGREVVRQESPNNPGARSRLFFHEDVREVLEEDTGTERVQAIVVHFPKGDDIIRLSPNAFKNMKRLRLFRCHNAHFSGEPNSLPNGIKVLDWQNCPLQSMPFNFHGKELIFLRMPGNRIRELTLESKKLKELDFSGCTFITILSNISSCQNLKKIDFRGCTNLVEVHDSVGFLDNLADLNLRGCFKLKSFPKRLRLRSLVSLDLHGCSSLQNFPEIECNKTKDLWSICLSGTAIEELPSSIGYLTGLAHLDLSECINLKRLPSSIHQLRSPLRVNLSACPNIISFGMEEEVHDGQPRTPYIVPTELFRWPLPKSSKSEYFTLDLINSGLPKSNFFEPCRFFPYISELNLSGSDIVSVPASIGRYVHLHHLQLNDCKQLQEIKAFPPNLTMLDANGCISLDSLPEISRVFNFPQESVINRIGLARCYKVVNTGICMPKPTWNRAKMIFPGNKIPDWFSHCMETSNCHRCEFDIKVSPPYNLDDVIGIAICAVIEPATVSTFDMIIGSVAFDTTLIQYKKNRFFVRPLKQYNMNRYLSFEDKMMSLRINLEKMDSDHHVWLWYLTKDDIKHRGGINLHQADNLRVIFGSSRMSGILKRCGVHLLYKQHEPNEKYNHENVDVHLNVAPIKDIEELANPMDHDDYDDYDDDSSIESESYPQQWKPASTLDIKLFLHASGPGQPGATIFTEPDYCYRCGNKTSRGRGEDCKSHTQDWC